MISGFDQLGNCFIWLVCRLLLDQDAELGHSKAAACCASADSSPYADISLLACSRGGLPLWPKKTKPTPGQCLHCGAQQVFEMQILAPLMHFLEETCGWLLDDEHDCTEQIECAMQVLSNWQWLTVAVFSCPHACQASAPSTSVAAGKQCVWHEQTVMLAMED